MFSDHVIVCQQIKFKVSVDFISVQLGYLTFYAGFENNSVSDVIWITTDFYKLFEECQRHHYSIVNVYAITRVIRDSLFTSAQTTSVNNNKRAKMGSIERFKELVFFLFLPPLCSERIVWSVQSYTVMNISIEETFSLPRFSTHLRLVYWLYTVRYIELWVPTTEFTGMFVIFYRFESYGEYDSTKYILKHS